MTLTAEDVETSSRMAGEVERWHVWPTLRRETVGHHTWNVLRIYMEIWGPPEPEVFTWIMVHDMPEIATGDVPFGGKGYMTPEQRSSLEDREYSAVRDQLPSLPDLVHSAFALPENLRRRAKVCDLIDMLEFASVELAMGNTLAGPIHSRISHGLGQYTVRMAPGERSCVQSYLDRTTGVLS